MSGPGTGATLTTDTLPKPSISVQKDWTRGLGSYEEITTETLSDAMISQPGQALHRLVAVPSGVISRRQRRTPTPKRRNQPTPKVAFKDEIKLEPMHTPIRNANLGRNRSTKVEPGVAQSTPKLEHKVKTEIKSPTTEVTRPKRNAKKVYENFKGLC